MARGMNTAQPAIGARAQVTNGWDEYGTGRAAITSAFKFESARFVPARVVSAPKASPPDAQRETISDYAAKGKRRVAASGS
jgi:hypothetical protein